MDPRTVFLTVLALGVGIATTTACSGPEAGTVYFSEAGFTEAEDEEEEEEEEAPRTKTKSTPASGPANTVFAKEVYPTLKESCGSCHQEGNALNAPVFFGKDAAATYSLFKESGYHVANSELVTKGVHAGPALTDAQKAAIDKWVAAEKGGG